MAEYVFTNEGLKVVMDRFANESPTREEPTKFGVGTGTTDAVITDTALETPIPFFGQEVVDTLDAADWSDSADMTTTVNSTTYLEGAGALDATKDGTGSSTAYADKSTTSLDFTNKELSIWVYIKDAAALAKLQVAIAFFVYFGQDSSNYWYWNKTKSFFSTGWNFVGGLTSSNADGSNGSPTLAGCDWTRFGFNSTASGDTWSAGDFIVDIIYLASSDDYYKDYEASYPTIDYSNFEVEIRSRLSSVEGNGHLISEMGSWNEDGTRKLITRANFTGFSKSNTDELIFTEKFTFSNTEG